MDLVRLKILWDAGFTGAEIARRFGVTREAVRQACDKNGWPLTTQCWGPGPHAGKGSGRAFRANGGLCGRCKRYRERKRAVARATEERS